MAETTTCGLCQDTGKIRYEEDWLDERGEVRGHTSGTRACKCVRDLPPTEGNATWWDGGTPWERHFEIPIGCEVATIGVYVEIPRRDDGRAVLLRGNRYYPALIEINGLHSATVHADTARELALTLLAAAEYADSIDAPCSDVCGHWWPCDCRTREPKR